MLSSRVAAMESIDELPGVRYHPAITDQARLIARWIEINCERRYCHWDGKIYRAVHDWLTKKGYLVTKRFCLNSDSDIYDWKESRTEWSITWDGFYKGEMPPGESHRARKIITQHDWMKALEDEKDV